MATSESQARSATISMTLRRTVETALLAWLAVIGLDFFLNAGILAPFYDWRLPGFLPVARMFAYIPLGYAAFLFWSTLLTWLMRQTQTIGFSRGTIFGARFGTLYGASEFLGARSLFAFPTRMMLCWSIVYFLVFTLAGGVIGAGFAAPKLRTVAYRVIGLTLIFLAFTIILQSLGWAPVPKLTAATTGIH